MEIDRNILGLLVQKGDLDIDSVVDFYRGKIDENELKYRINKIKVYNKSK